LAKAFLETAKGSITWSQTSFWITNGNFFPINGFIPGTKGGVLKMVWFHHHCFFHKSLAKLIAPCTIRIFSALSFEKQAMFYDLRQAKVSHWFQMAFGTIKLLWWRGTKFLGILFPFILLKSLGSLYILPRGYPLTEKPGFFQTGSQFSCVNTGGKGGQF